MQKRGHGWTTTAVRLACVLCFCAFTPSTVSAEPTQYDDLVAEYFGLFVVPAERSAHPSKGFDSARASSKWITIGL